MNAWGWLLIGIAARGVAFAGVAALVVRVVRRGRPALGASVSLAALTGLVVVSALALSPWPRWEGVWPVAPRVAASGSGAEGPGIARAGRTAAIDGPTANEAATGDPIGLESPWAAFVDALGREFREPTTVAGAAPDAAWRWPAWVALGMLTASASLLGRLLLGVAAVERLRRRSARVDDAGILEIRDVLQAEMSVPGRVELRESRQISAPATVGWLRPTLLLPPDWPSWGDAERRAVLAHELAHVRRGDYLAGLWAQACLALHVVNPLAHWLAGRLRLQQELAADAWAAALAGGRKPYLRTLAEMALRSDRSSVGWPARAFLPARDTFLRRLQMLRDDHDIQFRPPSRWARALTLATLAAAALVVAGVRGPAPTTARAQDDPAPKADAAAGPIDHRAYLTDRAEFVLTLDVATLLDQPDLRQLVERFAETPGPLKAFNVPVENLERVTLVGFAPSNAGATASRAFRLFRHHGLTILSTRNPQDWASTAEAVINDPIEVEYQGQTYVRSRNASRSESYFTPDDRTFVLGMEEAIQDAIRAAKAGQRASHAWDEALAQIDRGQLTVTFASAWLGRLLGPDGPGAASFEPLAQQADAYAIGLNALDGIKLDAVASCVTDDGATRVAETLGATRVLARNAVGASRQQAARLPAEAGQAMNRLIDRLEALLNHATIEPDARTVRIRSEADLSVAELVETLLPPVTAARIAAQRAQSVNHMKQIALAFHNYASTNGHFPPAVLRDPETNTPYSWRVAILPYIEQQALYDAYRFDEPWDGPNNIKLAEVVVPTYHSPAAPGNPAHTSYFVPTGDATLFSGAEGTEFTEITDGLHMTLMLVEAKREIPWTKPEDIPIDPDGPLPELGGIFEDGFNVAFADGAVRFLKESIDPGVLKAMFTKAGGEVISGAIPEPTERPPDR